MQDPRRLSARAALPALIALSLIAPVSAYAVAPLRVPGRLPAERFRRVATGTATGGAKATATSSASSFRVFDASALEERVNGRIFAVDPRQGGYSCSGTSLNTPSGSIVLTAGHCVLEHGRWGRDIVFVPGYERERRPFGTFPAVATYVMPQWQRSENADFDVAALRVGPSRLGRLASVVGARGYETGRSRRSKFQIFGYPAGASRGEELRSCRTHGLGSDSLTNVFPGPPTVPASCSMAGGSSGGAWIADGQYVDGVTSYGYSGNTSRLYSPYFGPEVGNFLSHLP
jgi:V8-like Glu-specific endopeptidase